MALSFKLFPAPFFLSTADIYAHAPLQPSCFRGAYASALLLLYCAAACKDVFTILLRVGRVGRERVVGLRKGVKRAGEIFGRALAEFARLTRIVSCVPRFTPIGGAMETSPAARQSAETSSVASLF